MEPVDEIVEPTPEQVDEPTPVADIEEMAAWPGPRNEDEWMDGNASVTPLVDANFARRSGAFLLSPGEWVPVPSTAPFISSENATSIAAITTHGYSASPLSPWATPGDRVMFGNIGLAGAQNGPFQFGWDGSAWVSRTPAMMAACAPGFVFPFDGRITAEDQPNADALTGFGYIASGPAWASGGGILINGTGRQFHWNGTGWAPGVAA
jgi:hypothetical protein